MMRIKNIIITSLMALGISSVPLLAQAKAHSIFPLHIANQTDNDLSILFSIGCMGITPAHSSGYISELLLSMACPFGSCTAVAYKSKDCKGSVIGQLSFNFMGLLPTNIVQDGYMLTGSMTTLMMIDHK